MRSKWRRECDRRYRIIRTKLRKHKVNILATKLWWNTLSKNLQLYSYFINLKGILFSVHVYLGPTSDNLHKEIFFVQEFLELASSCATSEDGLTKQGAMTKAIYFIFRMRFLLAGINGVGS